MKSVYRIGFVLSVCLLLVAPVAVLAQTTGTIEGAITDQSGAALPGVTVELAGVHLQGARTAVTTADGHYRFLNLTPGDYTVTATLAGFGKVQKKATVGLDATAQANLQLNLSTTAEVTVTGEAPLIDSTSTTSGSNFAGKVIDKLPLPSRNYADIVFTQPGVQADNGETQGRSLAISIYGSTSAENSFLIDGVNTTNVIKGIQGKDINNEFVQEVEVKTSGYQAEYGRNTGGIVNVITKSGGNEFHGGIFGYYNSLGLASDQKNTETPDFSQIGNAQLTTITNKNTRSEGGLDLGGYAWKDRMWFFAAYDRVITGTEIAPTTGPVSGDNFPATYTENKYSLKLTLNLAQSTTLQGVYFSDRQSQVGTISTNPQSTNPFQTQGRIDVGGPDYGARLNQLFGASGILTLSYGQHSDRYATQPNGRDGAAADRPDQHRRQGLPGLLRRFRLGLRTGREQLLEPPGVRRQLHRVRRQPRVQDRRRLREGLDPRARPTARARTATRSVPASRVPTAPATCRSRRSTRTPRAARTRCTTSTTYYTANGSDLTPLVVAPFDTPTKRYSGFLQDQWRVTPALTVNAGVRYDTETLYNGCAGTPDTDVCRTGPDGGAINPKAFSLTNEWAPRFGVTWDFAGDGTSKLYASAGRFYYAIPTDLNVRVFTGNTSYRSFSYNISDLSQIGPKCATGDPTPGCVRAPRQIVQIGSVAGEPTDPGIKASYQDEFTIGVEKAIDPTLSVGIKGTYRSLGRTVEDRCDLNYTPTDRQLLRAHEPGRDRHRQPGRDRPLRLLLRLGQPDRPELDQPARTARAPARARRSRPAKRIFKGIELVVRKQFTNEIWAQLSYLGSSLTGNYSGAISEASGQTDPGINADYDYADFIRNASGRLELDRPNQGRLDAVYNAPWGLSAGLQFYVRTGVPTSKSGYYNGFYTTELYLDQRGYAGRLPTDYEMNMSLGYNLNVGPVTITPMFYAFQLLNRQTATAVDTSVQPERVVRHGSVEPLLRPGGRPAGHHGPRGQLLPGCATASLHGQPGLPQDHGADRAAAVPLRAQGHVLRRTVSIRSLEGGGLGRPLFFRMRESTRGLRNA